MKININGKSYPIQFGFGALRRLGRKWNKKGLQGVINKIQDVFVNLEKEGDITFDAADVISDLVIAGMNLAGVKEEDLPSVDDVQDEMILGKNQQIEKVMEYFADSMGSDQDVVEDQKKKATK